MVESSFVICVVLLGFLSPLTAKPGAKPLAKSDPGHLVHDFYKCTSPVYRLSPECRQPAPQFGSGRIFSESEHFVEGGGGSQNPQQAAQNTWPSYGSNTGEKKNERMVMPVEEEESIIHDATEESSTGRIHDDAQTTTPVVDANHTAEEEESSTVETVESADISQQDQMDQMDQMDQIDLAEQSYQRVEGVSASVYDETTTKKEDSTQQVGLEDYGTEEDNVEDDKADEDNVEEDNAGQLFMETRNRTPAANQEQESSVWPSASYETIVLTPSIAHLPLENQEVTLTPGHLPRNKVQENGASQNHTSNVGHLPLEINNGPKNFDMLEQNPNISHLQPGMSNLEIVEEEMNIHGPLAEKDFADEEFPSVYDPIILMLQRP